MFSRNTFPSENDENGGGTETSASEDERCWPVHLIADLNHARRIHGVCSFVFEFETLKLKRRQPPTPHAKPHEESQTQSTKAVV